MWRMVASPLPRTPAKPDASTIAELRLFLRDRLGLSEELPEIPAAVRIEGEEHGPWLAEFWLFQPEPGIRLPGVLIEKKDADGPIFLVPGRDEEALARALDAGRRVFIFDPRGTGEISDGGGQKGTRIDEVKTCTRNWAWFAGRPWTGLWALDILQAARFCRGTLLGSAIVVDAQNRFGWAALLAGAAFPNLIQSGTVEIPVATLHDYLRIHGDNALADVPGLLERLDVPQLRALCPAIEVKVNLTSETK